MENNTGESGGNYHKNAQHWERLSLFAERDRHRNAGKSNVSP